MRRRAVAFPQARLVDVIESGLPVTVTVAHRIPPGALPFVGGRSKPRRCADSVTDIT